MASTYEKKNLLLGAGVAETLQNADDNFTTLFDAVDDLNEAIPKNTSELENDSGYITNSVNNLTNYTVKSETGTDIELTVDTTTYVMTLNLKNSAGTVVSTASVDLPIESLVVNATYASGVLTLTLQNGNTVDVDISALISGLVPDTRTVNGKNLKSNITLTQDDVGDGSTYVRTENNYTDAEKTKLAGVATGANKYTHPSYTARSSALYKITVDATGHVSSVTTVTKADITALGIPAQDTTYSNATTSEAGLMSASDKTKLDAIDESLQGVTADEIGKVKDVTLNGTSVLGSDGTANIVIDDLTSEYISVTASTSKTINGTTYYGFVCEETDTKFEVYNTDGQEIVTQRVRADGEMFVACSTTSGGTFTVRKVGGGAVGGAKYHHNIRIYGGSNPAFDISFDVYNSYSSKINTLALLKAYAQGQYSASGLVVTNTTTNFPRHINITDSEVKCGFCFLSGTLTSTSNFTISSASVADTVAEIK